MSTPDGFFNLNDVSHGHHRQLAPGLSARVFSGDHVTLSIVVVEPNACGELHSHSEEQWGVLLEGCGVRTQDGQAYEVRAGDFWRTPGGVSHSFQADASGARILDIFSPPRKAYLGPSDGFGTSGVK